MPAVGPGSSLDHLSSRRPWIVARREVAASAPDGHTRHMTILAPISRLTLIPEPRAEVPGATVVRRYHLLRLRLNGRPSPDRHAHPKRS